MSFLTIVNLCFFAGWPFKLGSPSEKAHPSLLEAALISNNEAAAGLGRCVGLQQVCRLSFASRRSSLTEQTTLVPLSLNVGKIEELYL